MKRERTFNGRWYPGSTYRAVMNLLGEMDKDLKVDVEPPLMGWREIQIGGSVGSETDRWTFDEPHELFDAIDVHRLSRSDVTLRADVAHISIFFNSAKGRTTIEIEARNRKIISALLAELDTPDNYLTLLETPDASTAPTIFIGHGRSGAWRDLKDHLADLHKYEVESFESGARAGHAVRDVIEAMSKNATFALLVFTAEDQQPDDTWRARQNVVHETGLFQGALGYKRAIVLLEDGVELFSNLDGIVWIGFPKGGIRAAFGDVLATLKREFGV